MQPLSKLIQIFSCIILLICTVVFIGWIIGSYTLITFSYLRPSAVGMESMKPITASCFFAFAIMLLLELKGHIKTTRLVVPLIFICSVVNIITHNIKELWFFDLENIMSEATAYIFMIGVVAFYLRGSLKKSYKTFSEVLIVIGFYLALFGMYGYVINYQALYSIYAFSSLSLPTTISFLLLLASIAMLHPSQGGLRIFFRSSLGGFIARRLLLLAFFLPIVVGLVIFKAVHTNALSDELGIVIIVTILSSVITLVGINSSLVVHRMDKKNLVLYRKTKASNRELKSAERRLKRQNQRLRSINQYLDDFVHALAHNLRGDLSNIQGLFEVKKDNPDFELDIFDQKIIYSVEKLDSTLTDIIRLVELQSKAEYDIHEIHFEDYLNKVLGNYKDAIEQLKPVIDADFSEKESICYIPEYLESILFHLLSNNLKYYKPDRQLNVLIRTQVENGYTLLKFSDNGLGIPSTVDSSKAFVPFVRLTTKGSGKGLGLFIVRSMVEKNGGKIRIKSEDGQGTELLVYLKEYEK